MKILGACPVCGGSGDPWADVHDRHYANEGTWKIDECERCSARYLNPMPSETELGNYYPTEYYSHQSTPVTGTSLKDRVKRIVLPLGSKEPEFTHAGRFVDVGSGSGWMLDHYASRGWDAVGVEYSEAACDVGRQRGRTMCCGSLIAAGLETESFDYVRSNHSFEHLNNPHETLAEMSRILKPGGTLFIGVPDTKGLMARVFRSEWYYTGAPVHTINYNRKNLAHLVEQHGFVVQSVRGNSTHGGPIGSLQSWFIKRRGRGSLSGGMVTMAPLILIGFWFSRLLDLCRLGDCVEIIATKPRAVPEPSQ